MQFHQKRIGNLAVWIFIAAGGYVAGWWHHSIRSVPPSSAPGDSASADLKAFDPGDGSPKSTVQRSTAEGPSPAGDGLLESADTPDYGQIVRQILADPEKAKYHNLYEPFRKWAKQDGAAAFAAFIAEPRLQTGDLPQTLFYVLGAADPESALALLGKLPLKPWNESAADGLAQGWASQSPETAAAAAAAGLAMPQGAMRRKFLSVVSATWMQKDPVALAAWLKSLPDEENLGSSWMIGFSAPELK